MQINAGVYGTRNTKLLSASRTISVCEKVCFSPQETVSMALTLVKDHSDGSWSYESLFYWTRTRPRFLMRNERLAFAVLQYPLSCPLISHLMFRGKISNSLLCARIKGIIQPMTVSFLQPRDKAWVNILAQTALLCTYSNHGLKEASVRFIQIATFTCGGASQRYEVAMYKQSKLNFNLQSNSESPIKTITIALPPGPPTSLKQTKYLDISYELKVKSVSCRNLWHDSRFYRFSGFSFNFQQLWHTKEIGNNSFSGFIIFWV